MQSFILFSSSLLEIKNLQTQFFFEFLIFKFTVSQNVTSLKKGCLLIISVLVFFYIWGVGAKFHTQLGRPQPAQQEFLAPICQTLHLDEVLGFRVWCQVASSDQGFWPDFYCLGQFFWLLFFYCFNSFLKSIRH